LANVRSAPGSRHRGHGSPVERVVVSRRRPDGTGRLTIRRQPDDMTCGPTALHAVYRYYGDRISLDRVVGEVPALESGGTLGVLLGSHAVGRGYRVRLYTYNLQVFDPTWFASDVVDLQAKLARQARSPKAWRVRETSEAYREFLARGGEVYFEDLTAAVLRRHLNIHEPILTGLSATYLYRAPRERAATNVPDDIEGEPAGHFVVLTGYDPRRRSVGVADPYPGHPLGTGPYYGVPIERLVGAIFLGALTFDGNLLVVTPR